MAGSIKHIKRRLKSVSSTAKLTRAMQMIATVKMRQAVQQSRHAVPFASETVTFLTRFAHYMTQNPMNHPYLNHHQEVKKVLGVVFAANRGMCGSFHSLLEKKIGQVVREPARILHHPFDSSAYAKVKVSQLDYDWVVIGKKGEQIIRRLGHRVIASFTKVSDSITASELDALFKTIKDAFDTLEYQKVVIFYTEYVSTLKQVPMLRQLLPISQEEVKRIADDWKLNLHTFEPRDTNKTNYLIEPNRLQLVEMISLLLLKMTLYHALVQTKASVESARMMAMKNATDAANEMHQVLNLVYNQLRQSKITSEIAEISAGRAALE